jgi:hypothetical protein
MPDRKCYLADIYHAESYTEGYAGTSEKIDVFQSGQECVVQVPTEDRVLLCAVVQEMTNDGTWHLVTFSFTCGQGLREATA